MFEGDWRVHPEMVAYVELLKSWVNNFGIDELFEPDEDGSFPKDKAFLLDDKFDKIWCIYNGFNDGPWLMRNIQESPYTELFIITKRSGQDLSNKNVGSHSNYSAEIWLSPEFDCPQCTQIEYPVDCALCEGDEKLDLPYYVLDSQGSEYVFPTGSYFSEN